jgi:hypothetical protein
MKSIIKTFALGLSAALALSLSAGQVFAGCTEAQQQQLGRAVADTVADEIKDKAVAQHKRLIKVEDCEATGDTLRSGFTYNYTDNRDSYAVEGTAVVAKDGKVEIRTLKRPEQVWASIDSNYVE